MTEVINVTHGSHTFRVSVWNRCLKNQITTGLFCLSKLFATKPYEVNAVL